MSLSDNNFTLNVHNVRPESVTIQAREYEGSRWIIIKIGASDVTIFPDRPEDFSGLCRAFGVEYYEDRPAPSLKDDLEWEHFRTTGAP